jgi:hypothetical protein
MQMRTLLAFLAGMALVALGFSPDPHVIAAPPMQITSPAYTCQFGNGGTSNVYPCAQYIVEVSPARLGGGVMIYQVTDTPFAVNGANVSTVAGGTISATSIHALVPGSSTDTFTLAVSQP